VHLVGFIIRIDHDAARSSECQIRIYISINAVLTHYVHRIVF